VGVFLGGVNDLFLIHGCRALQGAWEMEGWKGSHGQREMTTSKGPQPTSCEKPGIVQLVPKRVGMAEETCAIRVKKARGDHPKPYAGCGGGGGQRSQEWVSPTVKWKGKTTSTEGSGNSMLNTVKNTVYTAINPWWMLLCGR